MAWRINFAGLSWLVLAGQISSFGAPNEVDLSFDPGAGVNDYVNGLLLRNNKILIVGQFTYLHDAASSYAAWLNQDGTPDGSPLSGIYDDGHSYWQVGVYSVAAQPDGKILMGGSFAAPNQRRNLVRLNADGSLDDSFALGAFAAMNDIVDCVIVLRDGSIVVGGRGTSGSAKLMRLNLDGSVKDSLASLYSQTIQCAVRSMVQQPDDGILIGGEFTSISGVAKTNLVRLNPDGSLDNLFSAPTATSPVYSILLVEGGKMVVAGDPGNVRRLNADGSVDGTFTPYNTGWQIRAFTLQSDGKILCGGAYGSSMVRLNANGTKDDSFNTTFEDATVGYGTVKATAVQADGKILMAGWFTSVNGVGRQAIARLNSDGSLDGTFVNGPAGVGGDVLRVARQPDGKVLIGGWFQRVQSSVRNRVARLNGDGSLDDSFLAASSGANSLVKCFAIQSDGKIFVGGGFTSFNGVSRGRIARLNPDGALDNSFGANLAGANTGEVSSIALQEDGKVLVAGSFTRFNGVINNSLVRLNSDGSLDTFAAGVTPSASSYSPRVLVQPDGKILVAGAFTTIKFLPRTNLARLNLDGSLDSAFPNGTWPANLGGVADILLQPDGKIVVGGQYRGEGAWSYVARFNPDGSLDHSFRISTNIPGIGGLTALALQSDGKLLVGCWPSAIISSAAMTNLFRLNVNGTWDPTFVCSQAVPAGGIASVERQPDGKFLLGGLFGAINGTVRPYVARIMGENAALEILAPPQSQTAEAKTSASFTVLASGTPPLTYVWLFNVTNLLESSSENTLVLDGLEFGQSGKYQVLITNTTGAVTSAPAMLNVIAPVVRHQVVGLELSGESGNVLDVQYARAMAPGADWLPLSTVTLTSNPRFWFDLTTPLEAQRFYRALRTSGAGIPPYLSQSFLCPALELTGTVGSKVRVEGISRSGPTDAWFTLDTVTLTNAAQLFVDATAIGQPARLYRLTPAP